jgi:hypothetical protein
MMLDLFSWRDATVEAAFVPRRSRASWRRGDEGGQM